MWDTSTFCTNHKLILKAHFKKFGYAVVVCLWKEHEFGVVYADREGELDKAGSEKAV